MTSARSAHTSRMNLDVLGPGGPLRKLCVRKADGRPAAEGIAGLPRRTTMELSASQVRSLILDEHTVIRDVLEEIDETLGEMTRRVPGAIGRLRGTLRTFQDAFLRHLSHEETVLRPLLVDVDAWGPARVEAMDEEHRAQRAAIAELSRLALDLDIDATVQRIEDFVRRLRADMDGEEHHALSPEVLRDDIIVIDTFMG